METKKLSLTEMEGIEGEGWKACASFGLSFASMFTGPWGILGLAGMALSAGACENYLKSQ